jgi:hypothetical protein
MLKKYTSVLISKFAKVFSFGSMSSRNSVLLGDKVTKTLILTIYLNACLPSLIRGIKTNSWNATSIIMLL